jgi:hypothetical protein
LTRASRTSGTDGIVESEKSADLSCLKTLDSPVTRFHDVPDPIKAEDGTGGDPIGPRVCASMVKGRQLSMRYTLALLPLIAAGLVGWVTWSLAPARAWPAEAESATPDAPSRQSPRAERLLVSSIECQLCHKNGGIDGHPICQLTEYAVWDKHDKHKQAYSVLTGQRAAEIGKRLWNPETKSFGRDVTRDPGCLACHPRRVQTSATQENTPAVVEEGVGCVECHGGSELWLGEHWQVSRRGFWRQVFREKRAEEQRQNGLADVWDPAGRARMCVSCHIGDTGKGKVVTHEMYAVGHPPLPGFEVATFCDAMPPHWPAARKRSAEARAVFGFSDSAELEQTKSVIVGGMAAFAETMTLLQSQADAGMHADAKKGLDLAQFDCYACHHDLKSPSWRQERGYRGTPGRPAMRRWPGAVVILAIRHSAASKREKEVRVTEYRDRMAALQRAFDARPFGDPLAIAAAAGQMAEWTRPVVAALQKATYHRADAERFLQELCTDWSNKLPDYDTARQIAWALKTVYTEIDPKPTADAKIQTLLGQLNDELNLQLPSGQNDHIVTQLGPALQRRNDYEPNRSGHDKGAQSFQQTLKELGALLAKRHERADGVR